MSPNLELSTFSLSLIIASSALARQEPWRL